VKFSCGCTSWAVVWAETRRGRGAISQRHGGHRMSGALPRTKENWLAAGIQAGICCLRSADLQPQSPSTVVLLSRRQVVWFDCRSEAEESARFSAQPATPYITPNRSRHLSAHLPLFRGGDNACFNSGLKCWGAESCMDTKHGWQPHRSAFPSASRRNRLEDPQRSLPTPTILWFCDPTRNYCDPRN